MRRKHEAYIQSRCPQLHGTRQKGPVFIAEKPPPRKGSHATFRTDLPEAANFAWSHLLPLPYLESALLGH